MPFPRWPEPSVPQTIARRLFKVPFPERGLNTTASSVTLSPDTSPTMNNVRPINGELRTHPFLTSQASGMTGVVNGMFLLRRADGSFLNFASTATTINILTEPATWTNFFTLGSIFAQGLDEDGWCFVNLFDEVYASNAVGGIIRTLDGGSYDIVSTVYAGRYMEAFAGRLILADVSENGIGHNDRVRWSAEDNGTIFDPFTDATAGANDLVDLPGRITGIKALNGYCYVHKRVGITRMTETGLSTPSFAFQTAVDGVGAVAGNTIVNVRGLQFFLGPDNVYAYDGTSLPDPIGEPIRKSLFDTAANGGLNWDRIRTSFAIFYPDTNEYWLCVPLGTDTWPKHAYVFNIASNTWSTADLRTAVASGAMTIEESSDDSWDGGLPNTWDTGVDNPGDTWDVPAQAFHLVPIFGTNVGNSYIFDPNTTALPNTAVFDTADTDLGMPGMLKTLDRIRISARGLNNATFTAQTSTDGGVTFSTGTTYAFAPSAGGIYTDFFPGERITAERFRFRLSSSSRFAIVSIEAEFVDRMEVK